MGDFQDYASSTRSASLILSLKKIYLSRLPKKCSPKPTDQRQSQRTEEILLPPPTQADSAREITHLTFRQKIVKHFLSTHDKVVLGQAGVFIAASFLQKCCTWKVGNSDKERIGDSDLQLQAQKMLAVTSQVVFDTTYTTKENPNSARTSLTKTQSSCFL